MVLMRTSFHEFHADRLPRPVGRYHTSLVAAGHAQEFIDIVETIYRGARKGRGLVMSPKDWTTWDEAMMNLRVWWEAVRQSVEL